MARHGRSHKSGGGFLKHWAETQKTRAKTQLINAQRKLEKLRDKRYWDQVRHERRKALWNGLKTIGQGVRKAGKVIREGTKALAKGARSAGRGVGNAGKSIGNRINKATKPVRDAYKITQDRNKRRKEYEAKARREFEKKESLRSRGLAAPDGMKTKDTKSAVKDAVQRARKTTTTVSKHNRSKNGKTHEVGEHDRKLNPQEQDRQVADDLLKQSKAKKEPSPELKALQDKAKEAKRSAAASKRKMEAEQRKLDKIKSQDVNDHPRIKKLQAEHDRLTSETAEINRKTRSAKVSRPRKVTGNNSGNVVDISDRIAKRNDVIPKEPKAKNIPSWRDETKGDAS